MDGHGDGQALEGLFLCHALLDGAQGRHKILDPFDFHPAIFGQGHIRDNAHTVAPFPGFFRAQARNGLLHHTIRPAKLQPFFLLHAKAV